VNRTEKQAQIDDLGALFDHASFSVVAEYKGLTVADVTRLRDQLRPVDGRFRVVKNTLARRAVADRPAAPLASHFKGAVGVVFAHGDPAAAAKVVQGFAKEAKAFGISAGLVVGELLSPKQVAEIAELPSREQLLGRVVSALNSPVSGLVNVLAGPTRNLVYALSAVAAKKAA
jgi:large subunit ribosomal protein L10